MLHTFLVEIAFAGKSEHWRITSPSLPELDEIIQAPNAQEAAFRAGLAVAAVVMQRNQHSLAA